MKLTKDYLKKLVQEAMEDEGYEMEFVGRKKGPSLNKYGAYGSGDMDMDDEDDMMGDMGDEDELPVDTEEDTDSEIMNRLDDLEDRLSRLEAKAGSHKTSRHKEEDEEEDEEDDEEDEEEDEED